MNTIDDRLEAIREYVEKWVGRVYYDSPHGVIFAAEHETDHARIAFLLRQLDYAIEVIQALDEADELPPTVQYALDVYKRRVGR